MINYKNDIGAIDVHIHFGYGGLSYKTDTESIVRNMDAMNVELSIGSSFESISGDYRKGNDFAVRETKKFPDRLKAYLTLNPNYIDDLETYADSCFGTGNFAGIKLHCEAHGNSPVDEGMLKLYEYAEKHSIPVLSHLFGDFRTIGDIALRYPKLIMIAAHATARVQQPKLNARLELAEIKELAQRVGGRGNFYMDTATSVVPYGANELYARYFGAESILYGSDAGFIDPAYALGRILNSGFTKNEKRLILRENAKRLFKIK